MKHDFLTRMREIFAHFLSKLNEDTCHYINGPETLPPPLTKAEEQVVFQNIRDGKPNRTRPLLSRITCGLSCTLRKNLNRLP